VSFLTLLFLGVTKVEGWRSILGLVGAFAVLTTAVLAGAVGALAMWFHIRVRAPEPPRAPASEPSNAFREDAAHPARRKRSRKPPPTDETIDL